MPESVLESPPGSADAAAWREVALLVLGSTADHAVHCGDVEVESFRQLVRDSVAGLKESASSSQVLIAAGVLSQAIAHYSGQTQRQVDALLGDLRGTIQVFLGHLDRLHGDAVSQGLLAGLRDALERGLKAGDLAQTRDPVAEALKLLSEEAEAQRRQSLELVERLQDRVTILEQSTGARPVRPTVALSVDPCTGLPLRAHAEDAIRGSLEDQNHGYAAVFYLHRMALTNARFGEAIGNQVILFCSQHIATTVARGNDQVFRWSGPAFVCLLERPESMLNVSSEVQRIVSAPLSRFFETASRSVYLPIKMTAAVFPLHDTNFAELISKIETFTLSASGQATIE